VGALAGGITLVIFGLLLLGGTEFAWRGLLDAVLAGLGLAVVVGSVRGGYPRGLMVAGILLALVLLSVWRVDVPLTGGVRFHTVTPVTPADLAKPVRQSAGTLTVDLRRYPPGPLPPINASVGVGRLVVVEPPGTVLYGTAQVGGGYVSVGQASKTGVAVALPLFIPGAPTRGPADLRVGIGDLEVQSGK
jgi:hypothetical protein